MSRVCCRYGIPAMVRPQTKYGGPPPNSDFIQEQIDLNKMTFEKFLEALKGKVYMTSKYEFNYKMGLSPSKEEEETYAIIASESVGGMSGGSCWGDEAEPYSNPESYDSCRRDFDKQFDAVMLEICPTISFLQYKKIYNDCVKSGNNTRYEYYGNSSENVVIYCIMQELFDELQSMNLI